MTIDINTISTWIDTIANAISIATAIVGTVRATTAIARRITRRRTNRRTRRARNRNTRNRTRKHSPPRRHRDQGAHRGYPRWALARGRAPWECGNDVLPWWKERSRQCR